MTALLCSCHSKPRTRLALRPEAWLAAPPFMVWNILPFPLAEGAFRPDIWQTQKWGGGGCGWGVGGAMPSSQLLTALTAGCQGTSKDPLGALGASGKSGPSSVPPPPSISLQLSQL